MAFELATLDAPFAALKAYDWGGDSGPLKSIDDAVIAAHADPALRAAVEERLGAILGGGTSRAAREYACRKLMMIGTAASVPALAQLLASKDDSHMARFALERIGAPEAAAALRKALGELSGDLKIGMISSLAARRDAAAVPTIAGLLASEPKIAAAAATALGTIHTPEAVAVLSKAMADRATGAAAGTDGVARAVVDSLLVAAESLLAGGKRSEARAIYQSLADQAKGKPAARWLELAATRGLLACMDTSTAAM